MRRGSARRFLDLSLDEHLETQFVLAAPPDPKRARRDRDSDPQPVVMAGSSDGGAHLLSFCGADYTTRLLTEWVPDVLSLEAGRRAPHLGPGAPCTDLADRGVLRAGRPPTSSSSTRRGSRAGRDPLRPRLPRRQRALRRRRRRLRRDARQRRGAARRRTGTRGRPRGRSCVDASAAVDVKERERPWTLPLRCRSGPCVGNSSGAFSAHGKSSNFWFVPPWQSQTVAGVPLAVFQGMSRHLPPGSRISPRRVNAWLVPP